MLIPIVNLKDEIIGHKDRADIDYDNDIFRTASIWITNTRGDILLAQRKFDKKVDPGKWAEAVGGTVEGDDSYLTSVIREAEEELGLTISPEQLVLGPKQLITTPCNYFVQWYLLSTDLPVDAFTIQPEEVEQIAWIPPQQLDQELQEQPQKYIDALPTIVALLGAA